MGCRAKRAFFEVGGGVALRAALVFGKQSSFRELYGLVCAVLLVERRGE